MTNRGVVERIAAQDDKLFFQEHLARYTFASRRLYPGPTLDIATGTGYGANHVVSQAKTPFVVGADIDRPSLVAARRAFQHPSVTFAQASGTALPFAGESFANVISLETLEHIQNDHAFLDEIARVMFCHNSVCVISTPNREYSERSKRLNPFHVREYTRDELMAVLREHFDEVEMFCQGFTASYHQSVRSYAAEIQRRKANLVPAVRMFIDHVYRPLRHRVPASLQHSAIRRVLSLSYPQPKSSEIVITQDEIIDPNVFVAVCRRA
jgi:ubiquinone/menaquinone biosynthesis C-methylase UbiE